MAIVYYAGTAWLHWSTTVIYAILAFVVLISPISWISEDRKKAAKKAAEAAGGQPAGGAPA